MRFTPVPVATMMVLVMFLAGCTPAGDHQTAPTISPSPRAALPNPDDLHAGDTVDEITSELLAYTSTNKSAVKLFDGSYMIVDPETSLPDCVRQYVVDEASQFARSTFLTGSDTPNHGQHPELAGLVSDDAAFQGFLNRQSTALRKPLAFLVRLPDTDPEIWKVMASETVPASKIPPGVKADVARAAQAWAEANKVELFETR
ncbi:hypothetical protein ACVXZ4_12570 [Lacisediminihabitans sp. FW035]